MVPVLSPPLPSEAFVHRFPTPLAAAWRNTELTRTPGERRQHVIAAGDVAIRLLVAVLKADCDRAPNTLDDVEKAFARLTMGSFGAWADAVTVLCKALRALGGGVTGPLVDAWLDSSGRAGPAQLAFRDIVPLRNAAVHKGPALSEEAERKLEATQRAAVVAFLEALEPLADLLLFRVGAASSRRDGSLEGPWTVYRGTDEVVVPRTVSWAGHIDERTLHVWLPQAQHVLVVEPYIRVSPVASLNMDGIHVLSGLDRRGRLELRHDRSGSEQTLPYPAPLEGHASAVVIRSGLSRETGSMPALNGRVVGGRYELRSRLERGSVCDVWEGKDLKLGRSVAVKLLRDDVEPTADLAHRFDRESEVLARLDHPNIVRVLDHVHESDGRSALVLELVAGGSLRQKPGPNAVRDVIAWIRGALMGLEHAHAAGVVHRDLRPDNILLGVDGVTRLADFDLASMPLAGGAAGQTRTRLGVVGYLAPELLRGTPVSPASDIYALGATWDELLHGELRSQAEFGAGLDDDLRDIITEMTHDKPALRPTAAQLLERLPSRRRRAGATAPQPVISAPSSGRRWFPWFVGAVMTCFVAVVAWAIGSRYVGVEEPAVPRAALLEAVPVAQAEPARRSDETEAPSAAASARTVPSIPEVPSEPASPPTDGTLESPTAAPPPEPMPTQTQEQAGLNDAAMAVVPMADKALSPPPLPVMPRVEATPLGPWYGVLAGRRQPYELGKGPFFDDVEWAAPANECARACLPPSISRPCPAPADHVSRCVADCLPTNQD